MTPDIIFMWVPVITFGIFAARYARLRAYQPFVWYVGLSLIVIGWHQFDWPGAVEASILIWIVYGFVVPRLNALGFTAIVRRDYERARRLERWMNLLMPLPALRGHQELAQAYGLMEQGQVEEGLAVLDRVAASPSKDAATAAAQAHLIRAEYQQVVEIAGSEVGERNPSIRMLGIRALAELGRLDDAILAYDMEQNRFRTMTSGIEQALTRASLHTHAGDVETVKTLLAGPLSLFPQAERDLILARAEYFATGDWVIYQARLNQLRDQTGGAMRYRIEHWLKRGEQPRPTISAESRERLANANKEQADNRAYFHHVVTKPRVALALMAINVVIFLLTMDGSGQVNSRSDITAFAIFAYPYLAEQGEWWRLLTATFLHYNYLHVGFNMLALLIFGLNIERRVGHARFIAIYLVSGIGSMLAAIANYELQGETGPMLALGASGSIFGILGAVLALALLTYRRTKLFQARQDIQGVLIIILIQTAFDWMYLDGSSPLHISGLIAGFLITLLIAPRSATETAAPVSRSIVPPPDNR